MIDGTAVCAKMTATNIMGTSAVSDVGCGARIFIPVLPDPPRNLVNNADVTNKSRASFSWVDGASTGGKPILNYRVSYDQGSGNWVVLTSTLTS